VIVGNILLYGDTQHMLPRGLACWRPILAQLLLRVI
jgi:hypothetical protein